MSPEESTGVLTVAQQKEGGNEARERHPDVRVVALVADLDKLATEQQASSVITPGLRQGEAPVHIARLNNVKPYNLVSAAHTLAAALSDPTSFPAGSVFVITVDPHVGQNGDDGQNITDKRVIVRHEDGTVLIGPSHAYMRVGEFHGRGPITEVVEIDKDKLIELGLTKEHGNDVFDGLRRFGPAGAGILRGHSLEELGSPLDPELIPQLSIAAGTISDYEENYGNIRVEVPCEKFPLGADLAVRDAQGELLCIAHRAASFEGQEGSIVAANGSKYLIAGEPGQKALYLATVKGHLIEDIAERAGRKLQVGEQLQIDKATPQDLAQWKVQESLYKGWSALNSRLRSVRHRVFRAVAAGISRIPR